MTRIVWSTQSLMDSVRRDLNWNLEQRHFPRLGEVFPILSFSLSLFLVGAVKHELSFSQLVDRIPRVSSSVGPCLSVLARMHPAELLSGRSHLGTWAPGHPHPHSSKSPKLRQVREPGLHDPCHSPRYRLHFTGRIEVTRSTRPSGQRVLGAPRPRLQGQAHTLAQ